MGQAALWGRHRAPQIINLLELGLGGKFQAKST